MFNTHHVFGQERNRNTTLLFYPHFLSEVKDFPFFFNEHKNYYFSDSEPKFVKIRIVTSSNPTCAIIIFNQHIDAPQLSDCTKNVVLEV